MKIAERLFRMKHFIIFAAKPGIMYRYVFRFAVMSVTILTANLLTTMISNHLTGYRSDIKPLSFTLIAMGIIVVILYPLFARLESWVKGLSMRVVKKGRALGGKYAGLVIAFAACLLILCYFYARMWYNIDLFRIILKGQAGEYF